MIIWTFFIKNARALLCVLTIVSLMSAPLFSHAQTDNENEKISGENFRSTIKKQRQRTDVVILSKDDALDFEKKAAKKFEVPNVGLNTNQIVAILILAIAGAVLVWALYQSGFGRGVIGRRKDETPSELPVSNSPEITIAETVGFSLDGLAELGETKDALRLLVSNTMARAAKQNDLTLRRSLTTRDILRSVPHQWKHKTALQQIAAYSEPVLFGGHALTKEELLALIALARPIFNKKNFLLGGGL